MPVRAVVTTLVASLLLTAAPASAQETKAEQEKTVYGDLIFDVPLKLTKLSPSITKVAVECTLNKGREALTKRVEAAVSGGEAVGNVQVVFPTTQTAAFKPGAIVSYECGLLGLSADTKAAGLSAKAGGWQAFDPRNGAAFTVSQTPKSIVGDFKW